MYFAPITIVSVVNRVHYFHNINAHCDDIGLVYRPSGQHLTDLCRGLLLILFPFLFMPSLFSLCFSILYLLISDAREGVAVWNMLFVSLPSVKSCSISHCDVQRKFAWYRCTPLLIVDAKIRLIQRSMNMLGCLLKNTKRKKKKKSIMISWNIWNRMWMNSCMHKRISRAREG